MKEYTLELPYFKKGDDISFCLRETKSVSEAFLMHADHMEAAAAMCRRIAEFPELEVDADCHMIWVKGPQEILDKLVAEDLLSVTEWDDEEDEEDVTLFDACGACELENCEDCPICKDCAEENCDNCPHVVADEDPEESPASESVKP